MKHIRSYLLRKAPAGRVKTELARLFDDDAAGAALLLNERVMNLPPELAPRIQSNLVEDLEWAVAHAPSEADRAIFAGVRHVLVLAPCFAERAARPPKAGCGSSTTVGAGKKSRKAAGAATAAASAGVGDGDAEAEAADPHSVGPMSIAAAGSAAAGGAVPHSFFHFEEELYAELADIDFAFPVEPVDGSGRQSSSAAAQPRSIGEAGAGAAANTAAASSAAAASSSLDAPSSFSAPLRVAQLRRVLILGREALGRGVAAMDDLLARAQAAAAEEGGAIGSGVGAAAAAMVAAASGDSAAEAGAAAAPPSKRSRTH